MPSFRPKTKFNVSCGIFKAAGGAYCLNNPVSFLASLSSLDILSRSYFLFIKSGIFFESVLDSVRMYSKFMLVGS